MAGSNESSVKSSHFSLHTTDGCGVHWQESVTNVVGDHHTLVRYVELLEIKMAVYVKKTQAKEVENVCAATRATGIAAALIFGSTTRNAPAPTRTAIPAHMNVAIGPI